MTEALTSANSGLHLVVAANYGGCWDLSRAARLVARRVERGEIAAEAVDAAELSRHLCIADLPEPDLFIRTGGEQRVSNFLLWQLAYTELYFTETLWPDFNRGEFDRALDWYASRQRRFGRTGDQVVDLRIDPTNGHTFSAAHISNHGVAVGTHVAYDILTQL